MGKSKPPAEGTRIVFVFNYNEHEWYDDNATDETFAQIRQQVAPQLNWTLAPVDPNLDYYRAALVTTVEELQAHCEEVIANYEYPEGTLDAPFAKLATKMKSESWNFVGGRFQEFSANYTNTEIHVVLEKTAQKPAKKAAAKKPTKKASAKKPKAAKKPAAKKK